ncbi:Rpn family recombination-promoting nuclease/putative transposase, partial [Cronbergia sp. UHCC 0137]|uniref:Rpn family recombination-promoting nuclease/putative transposase n=1 Tax=Cronbergia sp. UHCC 0137 TaxID=3110239 RepID=UPI002B21CCDC
MYDNTCKFLAETFPTDFATWLLGTPIHFTKLKPSELSVEPIRADSLIFLQSISIILHIEFQTRPDPDLPFRMADYRLRLHRKFPEKEIWQFVIYLTPSDSPLVFQTNFQAGKLTHEFNVIRLWEQPTEIFQQYPGLLPLAVLTKTDNRIQTLTEVAKQIDNIEDRRVKSNVYS